MKLNERSVAEFSTSSAPIDKEGYLNKKGELNRGYQRRWFILKGNLLYYFERRSDKEPIGVVVLDNCHVELAESGEPYAFQISFGGDGVRTYVLGADTPQEMESWMRALTHANYDYLSMMVDGFENDLRRLTSEENELVSSVGASLAAEGSSLLPSDGGAVPRRQSASSKNGVPSLLLDLEDTESQSLPIRPQRRSNPQSPKGRYEPSLIDLDIDSDLPGQEDFSLNAFSSMPKMSEDLMLVSYSELQHLEEIHTEELVQFGPSGFYSRDDSVLSKSKVDGASSGLSRQPRWKSERRKNIVRSGLDGLDIPGRSRTIGRSVMFDVDNILSDNCSVFKHLHELYGASIWVKVKEFGKQDVLK